jgi:outer membrane receptor protein involved in Fe transport
MKKACILFLLFVCTGCFLYAQQIMIRGTIKNKMNNELLPSVSILTKGHSSGTYTDDKGNFSILIDSLPVTFIISSIGFETQENLIEHKERVIITLSPVSQLGEEIVVGATRFPTRIMESPVSIERIGGRSIRGAPTTSYYDLAGYSKGIDLTTSSLTFKTISTRGFNGSGSTRVNQLVDGMDNQAPGLNFFVGNFVGLTELDVDNIEILPGASSALYGPGGMNGTILINSKNPFQYQGLSVLIKEGVSNVDKRQRSNITPFHDFSFRWAKAFKNKIAFKVGAQYISATDWLASDSSNYTGGGITGRVIPGNRQTDPNYNGVNVYGDETSVDLKPFFEAAAQNPNYYPVVYPFLNKSTSVSRTGYAEKDIINPETKNIKLSGAVHYKLKSNLEVQLMGYWATGNSVYTGNNRYVFKDIKIGQYKLELRSSNWFLRGYTTQEDAGEAYSATAAPLVFNESWKRSYNPNDVNGSWYPQYFGAFLQGAATVFQQAYGAAKAAGQSDQQAMVAAQNAELNAALALHQGARAYADIGRPEPGSTRFKQIFDQVRKIPIPNGGRFLEKSQLWMTEGQYNFTNLFNFSDLIVGANWKKYILDSKGTLFIDTLHFIGINEVGAYAQVTKRLMQDYLTLSFSGRYDKNEDFKGRFTPRATALVKIARENNIRISYQTAYRFPSTQQKYIRLNVGAYTLLGGLPWIMKYLDPKTNPVVEIVNGVPSGTPYVYKEFKPESMESYEIGYKGVINKKLLVDAYAYYGKYTDFLGRNVLLQLTTGKVFSTVVNSSTKVNTHGFGLSLDYQLPENYSVFLNAYSDVITNVPSGFQAYFNSPKYRINAGFASSGLGKKKLIGFNVLYHWQDAFQWDGELANGPVNAFSTIDAQISYHIPRINSLIRLGGTNIFNHYYKNAYGNPEIGGLYYIAYGYNF